MSWLVCVSAIFSYRRLLSFAALSFCWFLFVSIFPRTFGHVLPLWLLAHDCLWRLVWLCLYRRLRRLGMSRLVCVFPLFLLSSFFLSVAVLISRQKWISVRGCRCSWTRFYVALIGVSHLALYFLVLLCVCNSLYLSLIFLLGYYLLGHLSRWGLSFFMAWLFECLRFTGDGRTRFILETTIGQISVLLALNLLLDTLLSHGKYFSLCYIDLHPRIICSCVYLDGFISTFRGHWKL